MTPTKKTCLAVAAAFAVAAALSPALAAPPAGRANLLQRGASGGRNAASARAAAQDPAVGGGPAASASAVDADAEKDKASDLNFMEAPLEMVFEVYAQLVDRTVLKDPATPAANITIQSRPGQKLTKEEQIEAIEIVLEMNGVHLEDYGEKFVRALPREKARQEGIPLILDEDADLPDSGRVASMMIPFKNIPIDEAKTVLEGLKSQKGLLNVYERIGKILVTDTVMNINRMRQVAKEVDVATPVNENVFVRQIKNASATDIKTALEQIVTESQKELEKAGAAAKTAQQGSSARPLATTPSGSLLRRPGGPNAKDAPPAAPANVESLVTSVSDADRGMIRGKVLIMADERSNKLVVVTAKTNMDFFDKVIEQLDVETTPDTVVKVYRLKYAEAEDVSDMINDLIGNTQKSSTRENQNAAARSGTGANLSSRAGGSQTPQRAQQHNAANQRSGEAKAGELTKDNTTVLADKRINGLVVMTQKELVPTVESIIESMDIKLSQVLIETAIIEVTLGDDLQTGVDWLQRGRQHVWNSVQQTDAAGRNMFYVVNEDGLIRGTAAEGTSVSSPSSGAYAGETWTLSELPVMSTVKTLVRDGLVNNSGYSLGGGGGSAPGLLQSLVGEVGTNGVGILSGLSSGGLNYFLKSDKLNLAAVIQASKTDSRAKYIASPIVMTVDNKEATIEATEARKFFNGYETSSSYSTYVRTPKYDAKDIGITIKVTPKINPNGTVMLTVEEEYSQLGAGQSILVDDGSSAFIDTALTRKMSADVLLEDKQTVVLGGLTQTRTSESESGIPLLKDIPWIGKWLFSSVTQSESRNELLVFMTPYVLNDSEVAQLEALRRKKALSDTNPWDDHGWSASELADPVAKKELMRRLKDEAKKQDEERQNRLAIEKWKLDRAKELEKMSDAERKFWLEQHRDALETKADKKAFDRETEALSQEELKALAEKIRAERVSKAQTEIDAAPEAAKELPPPADESSNPDQM